MPTSSRPKPKLTHPNLSTPNAAVAAWVGELKKAGFSVEPEGTATTDGPHNMFIFDVSRPKSRGHATVLVWDLGRALRIFCETNPVFIDIDASDDIERLQRTLRAEVAA